MCQAGCQANVVGKASRWSRCPAHPAGPQASSTRRQCPDHLVTATAAHDSAQQRARGEQRAPRRSRQARQAQMSRPHAAYARSVQRPCTPTTRTPPTRRAPAAPGAPVRAPPAPSRARRDTFLLHIFAPRGSLPRRATLRHSQRRMARRRPQAPSSTLSPPLPPPSARAARPPTPAPPASSQKNSHVFVVRGARRGALRGAHGWLAAPAGAHCAGSARPCAASARRPRSRPARRAPPRVPNLPRARVCPFTRDRLRGCDGKDTSAHTCAPPLSGLLRHPE